MAKYTRIGGQALIEGILMKSPEKSALAVRKPDKEISITYLEQKSIREKYKFFDLPIIRGAVAFVESLISGYKAMMMSADISGYTDIEEEKEKEDKKDNNLFVNIIMAVASVLGVLLAVVLFLLIPRLAVSGLNLLFNTEIKGAGAMAIEQGIKIVVLVLYVFLVSLMKDIKRVFMYHGAEHKTIFCYEHGLPLTVENVRKERRFHPRCGTSFMILMILVSFIVSFVVQLIFRGVYDNPAVWVAVKILMIPIICGLGFELLSICGKYDNVITRIIAAPGMWLQRITTKEPEDDMIEIAIAALKACEPAVPDVERPKESDDTDE